MIDENFYELLEQKIGDALENSDNEEARHFWCDGVLPGFEHEYAKKYVNDNRKILMTAYLGKTGQDLYQLTLHFGPRALSRYARGLDISPCMPESHSRNWFEIDIPKRNIWIHLD